MCLAKQLPVQNPLYCLSWVSPSIKMTWLSLYCNAFSAAVSFSLRQQPIGAKWTHRRIYTQTDSHISIEWFLLGFQCRNAATGIRRTSGYSWTTNVTPYTTCTPQNTPHPDPSQSIWNSRPDKSSGWRTITPRLSMVLEMMGLSIPGLQDTYYIHCSCDRNMDLWLQRSPSVLSGQYATAYRSSSN